MFPRSPKCSPATGCSGHSFYRLWHQEYKVQDLHHSFALLRELVNLSACLLISRSSALYKTVHIYRQGPPLTCLVLTSHLSILAVDLSVGPSSYLSNSVVHTAPCTLHFSVHLYTVLLWTVNHAWLVPQFVQQWKYYLCWQGSRQNYKTLCCSLDIMEPASIPHLACW